MREILFRGKRIDNNQWIEGTLIATTAIQTKYYVVDSCWCESQRITEKGCADFNWIEAYDVIPSTVGQYTGLTDKNGTKIFEVDIPKGIGGLHRVYFDTSLACFEWAKINGNWKESFSGFADEYEVIGNIHDNSELLERSNNID